MRLVRPLLALAPLLVSCAAPPRSGPVVGGPWGMVPAPWPAPPTAAPAPPPAAPKERVEVAVLPIEDDEVFRAERVALRDQLGARMVALAPHLTLVPRAAVDEALRPLSKSGKPCANPTVEPEKVVQDRGWAYTDIQTVFGSEAKGAELWIKVLRWEQEHAGFTAPFPNGDAAAAYASAFSRLVPQSEQWGGLLGALSGAPRVALDGGTLSACEKQSLFQCAPSTAQWADQKAAFSACFAGADEGREVLLFESQSDRMTRCELAAYERPEPAEAAREACLCNAAAASSALKAASGRRRLELAYLAPSLVGLPRPAVHFSRLSPSLRHRLGSYYPPEAEQKKGRVPLTYLETAGRWELETSLARCAPKGGAGHSTLTLSLTETGSVAEATLLGASGAKEGECAVNVARKARFTCPTDGKAALADVTVRWGATQ